MKNIYQTIIIACVMILSLPACSSEDEFDLPGQGYKDWVEANIGMRPGYLYSEGKMYSWWPSTKDIPEVAQIAAQADNEPVNPRTVGVRDYGTLRQETGPDALDIDHLKVVGPIEPVDFSFMRECVMKGKLRTIDLSEAETKGGIIPDYAFFGPMGYMTPVYMPLLKISLPRNTREIGRCAFVATLLSEVTMNKGLKVIGNRSFAECHYLKDALKLPESLVEIRDSAFFRVEALKRVEIPGSVKTIGRWAFCGRQITELIIHEGVETIKPYAFNYSSISELILPKSIKTIGQAAFIGIPTLRKIYSLNPIPPKAENDGTDKFLPWQKPVYPDAFGVPGSSSGTGTPRDIPVYVPAGSEAEYARTKGWDWFSNFIPLP